MGAGRLCRGARRENRQAMSADRAIRDSRSTHTRRAISAPAIKARSRLKPFHFDSFGTLCVVGHHTACAEIKGLQIQRLFCLVSLAHHLSKQASRFRTQGASSKRLDNRAVLPARHCANDRVSCAFEENQPHEIRGFSHIRRRNTRCVRRRGACMARPGDTDRHLTRRNSWSDLCAPHAVPHHNTGRRFALGSRLCLSALARRTRRHFAENSSHINQWECWTRRVRISRN